MCQLMTLLQKVRKIPAFLSSKMLSLFVAFMSLVWEFVSLPLEIDSYATI